MDLKTFLKNYSPINKQFLDEFLSFYSENTLDIDLVINLELVIKWLNVKKGVIKKTLVNSYKKNIDYSITPIKKKIGEGSGPPSELIIITPRCFKKICMLTRSKNGENVRNYYLELEIMVDKYKNYLIKIMNEKIKTLEYNQKSKSKYPKTGCIYIINANCKDCKNLYKLGKTENLRDRLKTYNTGNADDIEVLYHYDVKDNIDKLEKCVKIQIKQYQYRKYKEVYQVNIDILKNVIKQCDKFKLILKGGNINEINGEVFLLILKDK
jgi:hypothetical protein